MRGKIAQLVSRARQYMYCCLASKSVEAEAAAAAKTTTTTKRQQKCGTDKGEIPIPMPIREKEREREQAKMRLTQKSSADSWMAMVSAMQYSCRVVLAHFVSPSLSSARLERRTITLLQQISMSTVGYDQKEAKANEPAQRGSQSHDQPALPG